MDILSTFLLGLFSDRVGAGIGVAFEKLKNGRASLDPYQNEHIERAVRRASLRAAKACIEVACVEAGGADQLTTPPKSGHFEASWASGQSGYNPAEKAIHKIDEEVKELYKSSTTGMQKQHFAKWEDIVGETLDGLSNLEESDAVRTVIDAVYREILALGEWEGGPAGLRLAFDCAENGFLIHFKDAMHREIKDPNFTEFSKIYNALTLRRIETGLEAAKTEILTALEQSSQKHSQETISTITALLSKSINELAKRNDPVSKESLIDAQQGDSIGAAQRLANKAVQLEKVETADGNEAVELYKSAAALVFFSEMSLAKRYLKRALTLNFDFDAAIRLAHLHILENETTEAEDLLTKIIGHSDVDLNILGPTFGNLGNANLASRDFNRAKTNFESSLFFYRKSGNDFMIPTIYGDLGSLYLQLGETEKAESLLKDAVIGNLSVNNVQSLAVALNNLGEFNKNRRNYEDAYGNFNRSAEYFGRVGNSHGEVKALSNFALVAEMRGRYNEAYSALQRACYTCSREQNYQGLVRAKNLTGCLLQKFDKIEEAIAEFKDANDLSNVHLGCADAQSSGNLAVSYYKGGKVDEAIGLMNNVIEICRKNKDKAGEAAALGNLGIWYTNLNRFSDAETLLLLSEKLHSQLSDVSGVIQNLQSLLDCYSLQRNHSETKKSLKKLIELANRPEDLEVKGIALLNLGILMHEQKEEDDEAAKGMILNARLIFSELENKDLIEYADQFREKMAK